MTMSKEMMEQTYEKLCEKVNGEIKFIRWAGRVCMVDNEKIDEVVVMGDGIRIDLEHRIEMKKQDRSACWIRSEKELARMRELENEIDELLERLNALLILDEIIITEDEVRN